MNYSQQYFLEVKEIVNKIDSNSIEQIAQLLSQLREAEGRLFILGVGGSAASASHAVNDFRKITGIEAYAPTDNVAELTARTNDEGWNSVFRTWLEGSHLNKKDMILVFSVGGGNIKKNISANLVYALQYAKEIGAKVIGIVGRDGGYTAKIADAYVIIPIVNQESITPHTEAFHNVISHLLVSHPLLKINPTKWESEK
jgi:D-sedoheptulose 7-phosphate isomerase